MIVQRDLLAKIKPFLKRREFLAIIGPRQSGKTIFLEMLRDYLVKKKHVRKQLIQIITFEDRKLLNQFEKDPVTLVRSFMPELSSGEKFYLLIDEFQYAEEGGQKLKFLYDTDKKLKILVTGSSSLEIKAQVGKYMVGRILSFNLYPFNFREYLYARNKRLEKIYSQHNERVVKYLLEARPFAPPEGRDLFYEDFNGLYEKYSIWGGYPAVVLTRMENERRKVLADIYNNYILRDIKGLLELATERNLFNLSQYLAIQIGNLVVYQNLCQISGMDHRNLQKHLQVLAETFVCRELRPFFRNRQKELSKSPKIFYLDMGFRNNLMEMMSSLEKRPDAGAIIENVVFVRLNELCEGAVKINYWRTKAGAEVDFVLSMGRQIIPIEVKYSSFSTAKLSKSLANFIDTFNPGCAMVLTKDYWGHVIRGKTKILFLPVYYL